MTLPTRSIRPPLADVLSEIEVIAENVKSRATGARNRSAAQSVSALAILDFQAGLKKRMERLKELRSAAGLQQYARDQLVDQAMDILADIDATVAEMQLTLDQVRADLPVSATGFVEARKIETDDAITNKTFTPGQTANLRTRLDALIATID